MGCARRHPRRRRLQRRRQHRSCGVSAVDWPVVRAGQAAVQFGSSATSRCLATTTATEQRIARCIGRRPATGSCRTRRPCSGGFPAISPCPATTTATGADDCAVFRPSTGTWFVRNQATVQFGLPGDIPVPGDYNGDGRRTSRCFGRPRAVVRARPGRRASWAPGRHPVPGDYNGDGTTDRAVFRPSTGQWFVQGQATVQFGLAGDVPVAGDPSVGRPHRGRHAWISAGDLAIRCNGTTDIDGVSASSGVWFGGPEPLCSGDSAGDIPVTGRLQRQRHNRHRAVFRPSTGVWFVQGQAAVQWGLPGDIPCPATTTATGRPTSPCFARRPARGSCTTRPRCSGASPATSRCPATTTATGRRTSRCFGRRPVRGSCQNQATVQLGLAGDVPVPGDYDGNGTTDFAVTSPVHWHVVRAGHGAVQWGLPGTSRTGRLQRQRHGRTSRCIGRRRALGSCRARHQDSGDSQKMSRRLEAIRDADQRSL